MMVARKLEVLKALKQDLSAEQALDILSMYFSYWSRYTLHNEERVVLCSVGAMAATSREACSAACVGALNHCHLLGLERSMCIYAGLLLM